MFLEEQEHVHLQCIYYSNLEYWVDSSKRWNDAENLTLLNKSFDVIKQSKIFGIALTSRRIHPFFVLLKVQLPI